MVVGTACAKNNYGQCIKSSRAQRNVPFIFPLVDKKRGSEVSITLWIDASLLRSLILALQPPLYRIQDGLCRRELFDEVEFLF